MVQLAERISSQPLTIPHVLRAAALRRPDKVAIEGEDGVHVTFSELLERCERAAAAFLANDLQRGDRVCIWAPNSTSWIVAAIGAQLAGGVLVPVNTRFKGPEAAYIISRSGARFLFSAGNFLGTDYFALLKNQSLPNLKIQVSLDSVGSDAESWDDFLKSGANVSDEKLNQTFGVLNGDDLSDILFTSGTTGHPKGAMCTHAQVITTFQTWADYVGLHEGDRYLIVNPFFHTFGYKAGWVACLLTGATMLPHAVFDADTVLLRIEKAKVTVLPGPPTLYQSMLSSPQFKDADISSLRMAVTGAASVPLRLVEQMRSDLGFETVLTAYGLTETNGVVSICSAADSAEQIARTSGKAVPGVEVRCVDASGQNVSAGEPGEILVRGYNVMKGYFDDPVATAEAIDSEGWLKTGDIGVIDGDGYIRITDRAKDMFIVGGFNCYPAEIEELILNNSNVAQVAVVGVPDARMGEVAKAFVVRRAGADISEAGLIAWCRETMANYKVPRSIEFMDTLPVTASGKVQRFALREGSAK
tara:strand:- start:1236 stop:2825 length:1590 start_codon:yes stop_codon:yes gene_type:complete